MKNFYNKFFNTPKYFAILFGPLSGYKIFMAPRHGYKKIIGIYEKKIVENICKNVKSKDVCIDLGSHVGYLTLLMSKLSGIKGFVLAIDPVKECCDLLDKSIKANKIKNIKILNYGVGDKNINKKAYVFEDSGMANFEDSGFKIYKGEETFNYKLKKLDDIVKSLKLSKIDFIKIDIEGYEYKALLGAKNVLKNKPKMLIEIHGHRDYKKIFILLKSYNYTIYDLNNKEIHNYKKRMERVFHIIAL